MFAPILVIVLLQFNCIIGQKPRFGDDGDISWTYGDQNEWDLHFAACNGTHESPVDIDSTKVVIDSHLRIEFYNYDEEFHKTTAQNNGHTVRVFLHPNDKNQIPYVSGEAIDNRKFILDSFHFHWGLNEFNGSEHSINGVKRSAELHLVHWNEIYGNISNARDRENGLLVVTVFIETKIIREYGIVHIIAHNPALVPIINILPKIRHFENSTKIRVPINLKELIPKNKDVFYKYQGSLTTPPCSPTATFIIFSDPIYMTRKQLSQFRHHWQVNGQIRPMTYNTREQMPLEDRVIKVSNPFKSNTEIVE